MLRTQKPSKMPVSHSFNKQLLNTYFVTGTVLVTGEKKAMNKTGKNFSLDGIYILAENISLNSAYNYLLLQLNQWVLMPPRVYLAKFGNIFSCHNLGRGIAVGIQQVGTRDADIQITQNVNSADVEKPYFKGYVWAWLILNKTL